MKKTIAFMFTLIGALSLIFGYMLSPLGAAAHPPEISVYVTIATGEIRLAQEKVIVTDMDGDGALTVYDALYAAHENFYEGGAEGGFALSDTALGKAISRLWGLENGGSYGYYVNHSMAMSLSDGIEEGDRINAFAYTDTEGFSDVYCYFDLDFADVRVGEPVALTLFAAGFDDNWESVELKITGAAVTVNGEAAGLQTDGEGRAVLTFHEPGTYLVSATLAGQAVVPPVCKITAEHPVPSTSDDASYVLHAVSALLCAAGAIYPFRRGGRLNAK